jgi:CMP-N-acetylneuraminic acid synthetase
MFDGLSVLAVVPARGGSKGIPRKNVRLLGGYPLLAWSVAAAQESRSVDRILVSTDDTEIRDVAVRCGADAPFLRPSDLAQDASPDLPLFQHAVDWLERHERFRPDLIVQLRPTSPFRPPGLVEEGLARLAADPRADSLRAVTAPGQNPYKMWRTPAGSPYLAALLDDAGPEAYNRARQELPATLWQTGHLDVFRRETLARGSLTGERVLGLEVPARYAVDIDSLEHWDYAEWLLRRGGMAVVDPGRRPCPVNG